VFRRNTVLRKALRRRVAINFLDGHGGFIGRLAEFDSDTYVLEQCTTIPAPGETAQPIAGRQYVDRIHAFLQELGEPA
jgi:hypothetical protein